ncbi:hypothetical protein DL89DRAFT_41501 [Linderina pennispora]|uniref:Uncharacterized protein n=1 Tax=Linderina pennispora TaxID=61395 RepID=A0A1Y1W411_9FUNG|nr:uncharacterized protein DL89DRAFT_41501 [Linderina pennispora]ORX68055.1 hypothetical protein DL89DRAFT_41501 [Linderina pennispora]
MDAGRVSRSVVFFICDYKNRLIPRSKFIALTPFMQIGWPIDTGAEAKGPSPLPPELNRNMRVPSTLGETAWAGQTGRGTGSGWQQGGQNREMSSHSMIQRSSGDSDLSPIGWRRTPPPPDTLLAPRNSCFFVWCSRASAALARKLEGLSLVTRSPACGTRAPLWRIAARRLRVVQVEMQAGMTQFYLAQPFRACS